MSRAMIFDEERENTDDTEWEDDSIPDCNSYKRQYLRLDCVDGIHLAFQHFYVDLLFVFQLCIQRNRLYSPITTVHLTLAVSIQLVMMQK